MASIVKPPYEEELGERQQLVNETGEAIVSDDGLGVKTVN